jgi:hypothetical protein
MKPAELSAISEALQLAQNIHSTMQCIAGLHMQRKLLSLLDFRALFHSYILPAAEHALPHQVSAQLCAGLTAKRGNASKFATLEAWLRESGQATLVLQYSGVGSALICHHLSGPAGLLSGAAAALEWLGQQDGSRTQEVLQLLSKGEFLTHQLQQALCVVAVPAVYEWFAAARAGDPAAAAAAAGPTAAAVTVKLEPAQQSVQQRLQAKLLQMFKVGSVQVSATCKSAMPVDSDCDLFAFTVSIGARDALVNADLMSPRYCCRCTRNAFVWQRLQLSAALHSPFLLWGMTCW